MKKLVTLLVLVGIMFTSAMAQPDTVRVSNKHINTKYLKPGTRQYLVTISNPKDAKAYNNRGLVRYGLKDYSGAIADYTKALTINTRYEEAYYNRGAPKYNLGDKAGACADWTKAKQLGVKEADQYLKKFCK